MCLGCIERVSLPHELIGETWGIPLALDDLAHLLGHDVWWSAHIQNSKDFKGEIRYFYPFRRC
jgi:hypothetical protein